MIRLIVLLAIHMAVLIVLGFGAKSEPTLVSELAIPGMEDCGGDAAGFDKACMDRNHARIIQHVTTEPVTVLPPKVDPLWLPVLSLGLGFLVWDAARRVKSSAAYLLTAASYSVATAVGILSQLGMLAILVAGLLVLIMHSLRKHKSVEVRRPGS